MKNKFYVVIGLVAIHASATICVLLTIIGWTFANGESLHPQPEPDALKNLEIFGSILAFPILKVLNQGFHFIRFQVPGVFEIPFLCALIIMNSASLILLCFGLWLLIKRYLRRTTKNAQANNALHSD